MAARNQREARTFVPFEGKPGPGDVVIIGAGLAGLFTALKLAPLPVTVIAAAPLGDDVGVGGARLGLGPLVGTGLLERRVDDGVGGELLERVVTGVAAVDEQFGGLQVVATVELRDGQSFSVAGLLQNNTNLSQNQLPWLGDVPILGSLFKSSSYQKHDTELVVIVTPRLVRPSGPGQVLATPFDGTQPANDPQFFALGQMEVTPRMIQSYQTGAGVSGPYGYIIDLGAGS